MISTSSRLLSSDYTSSCLKRKLATCGTKIANGNRTWCRSPACSRCRSHRARYIAEAVAEWMMDLPAIYRTRRLSATTKPYTDPASMLDEVRYTRRALTKAFDHGQRANSRWASLAIYSAWRPIWREGMWHAELDGLAYLGTTPEIAFGNVIGRIGGVRLSPLPSQPRRQDARDIMIWALSSTDGLDGCADCNLASLYTEVDRRGGFKALIARRGMSL